MECGYQKITGCDQHASGCKKNQENWKLGVKNPQKKQLRHEHELQYCSEIMVKTYNRLSILRIVHCHIFYSDIQDYCVQMVSVYVCSQLV